MLMSRCLAKSFTDLSEQRIARCFCVRNLMKIFVVATDSVNVVVVNYDSVAAAGMWLQLALAVETTKRHE